MKIICIGRNYADHAKEMKSDIPKEPIFFLKPDVALLKDGGDFYYPEFTNELHYECEIVVRIDKSGKNIAEKFAHKYYSEYTLGLDMTARDLQQKCKEKGLPWEIGKSFDNSALISTKFLSIQKEKIDNLTFSLKKDGQIVQVGNTKDFIFSIDQLIAYVSQFITLKTGDLIYTGTPAGVGPVVMGETLEGYIQDEKMFTFRVN